MLTMRFGTTGLRRRTADRPALTLGDYECDQQSIIGCPPTLDALLSMVIPRRLLFPSIFSRD